MRTLSTILFTSIQLLLVGTVYAQAGWVQQSSGTANWLNGAYFTDANNGFVVGSSYPSGSAAILRTTNGGATWTSQSSVEWQDLYAVAFTDSCTGIAVGGFNIGHNMGTTTSGCILRTTNAGVTWSYQKSGLFESLKAVKFTDPDNGWAVGFGFAEGIKGPSLSTNVILHTSDGGSNWEVQKADTAERGFVNMYTSLCFTNSTTGTVVGDSGTILHTTDGGASWTKQLSGTISFLRFVCFKDENVGLVFGLTTDSSEFPIGPFVLRTTNGGLTWLRQSLDAVVESACFSDTNTCTAVGHVPDSIGYPHGTILRTTNCGESWVVQASGLGYSLSSVSFTDAKNGTAVGGTLDSGVIFRTTTGGTTWIENNKVLETPHEFSIKQNYPNPYNNGTIISYQLTTQAHVTLKVFDVLGREVATLMNNMEEAGYKSVSFDASTLPSGVYFYRMQAGSFVQTNKMLLMK